MKQLLIFLIFTLFILPAYSQKGVYKNDYNGFQYFKNFQEIITKNKIKSEIIYEFNTKNSKDSSIVTSILYNNIGDTYKYNTFQNKLLHNSVDMMFDTLTNIQTVTNYFIRNNKVYDSTKSYKFYDSIKILLKEIYNNPINGDTIIREYIFSDKKYPHSTFVRIGKKTRFLSDLYFYENEKLIRTEYYSSIDELVFSYVNTFSSDYTIERTEFVKKGKSFPVSLKYYNFKGELIKMIMNIPDKNSEWDNKRWNKKRLTSTTEFFYATNGLLTERKLTKSNSEIIIEKRYYF